MKPIPIKPVEPKEKISVQQIDPAKYGLKSFDSLFDDLDDSTPQSPSVSHAKEMMRRGEELRAKSSSERHARLEEAKQLESIPLDDLEKELDNLDEELSDIDLDDDDFAAVGGKYVRKVRVDSDDDSSD